MNEISLWPLAASIEGWKEQTYEFYLVATVMDGCHVIGSSSLLFTASGHHHTQCQVHAQQPDKEYREETASIA